MDWSMVCSVILSINFKGWVLGVWGSRPTDGSMVLKLIHDLSCHYISSCLEHGFSGSWGSLPTNWSMVSGQSTVHPVSPSINFRLQILEGCRWPSTDHKDKLWVTLQSMGRNFGLHLQLLEIWFLVSFWIRGVTTSVIKNDTQFLPFILR